LATLASFGTTRLETFGGSSPATGAAAEKKNPAPQTTANNAELALATHCLNRFACRMSSSQVVGIAAELELFQPER
jgi:hypothetical protein